MFVIYGKDSLTDPKKEFEKDFINKEEYHQITIDEYSFRKNVSDAFNSIAIVVSEAFDRIDKGLKALAEQWGMSYEEAAGSIEKMLNKVQEFKEPTHSPSKMMLKQCGMYEHRKDLNLTSVVIPKKKFHKARGRLKC